MNKQLLQVIRRLDDFIYSYISTSNVLFIAGGLYGFLCQWPIVMELEKKNNVRIGITVTSDADFESITNTSDKKIKDTFLKYLVPESKAQYMKWTYVVSTHLNSFYPRRNTLRVGMHHGPGFGTTSSKAGLVKNYDLFFGLSSFEEDYLISVDPDLFSGGLKFYPIGFPKSDCIVNNPIRREKQLEKFGLPNKPTLLIASHWLEISLLNVFQGELFDRLAEAFPNHNIIQTGHPWMWKQSKDDRKKVRENQFHSISDDETSQIFKDLSEITNRHGNAYFIHDVLAEELIPMADLLIVDVSTIITTYCLLDRPIVWFKNPQLTYSSTEVEKLYRDASVCFSDLGNIEEVCQKELNDPKRREEGRRRMRDAMYNNPGSASVHAANILSSKIL